MADTWTPTAGRRAYSTSLRCVVDVLRVYGKTATVTAPTEGIAGEGRMTFRGQRLATLQPAGRAPVMTECDECGGSGEVELRCVECGTEITEAMYARDPESGLCPPCMRRDDAR